MRRSNFALRGSCASNPYRQPYRKSQTRPKAGNEAKCPAENAPKPQPARKVPAADHRKATLIRAGVNEDDIRSEDFAGY